MQYTSGSTGRAKGVSHTADGIAALLRTAGDILGLRAGDRVLSAARMSFGYGFGNSVLCPLAAEPPSSCCAAPWTPRRHRRRQTAPAHGAVPRPRMYAALLDRLPDDAPEALGEVRLCVTAGGRCPRRSPSASARPSAPGS
ncbi:AMP-binding protein [Streptomyces sp. M19]